MPAAPATIACLTDFGTQDAFVGIMKGVIVRVAADARVIDLTHEIPPGDVRQASIRLWQAAPHLPEDTIYLAVVDPGVGTPRKGVALGWDKVRAVGPDNGIFTHLIDLLGTPDSVELSASRDPGMRATFHGRDLFAPAAARLAAGAPLRDLGKPVRDLVLLSPERLEVLEPLKVQGEVLFADHFGNLVTSIGVLEDRETHISLVPWVGGASAASLPVTGLTAVLANGQALPLRRTFSDAAPGEALAYIGSDGLLELAVNQGRASDVLRAAPGTLIRLESRG